MGLPELQRVIDATKAGAAISPEAPLASLADALWTQELINKCWGVTLATIRDDGTPHGVISFAVCVDGAIYLAARRGTVLLHNLRARSEAALTCLGEPMDSIMAVGIVEPLGAWADLDWSLKESMNTARSTGEYVFPAWPGYIFRFTPSRLTKISG